MKPANKKQKTDSPAYQLYKKLYDVYKKCHSFEKDGRLLQSTVNDIWNKAKAEHKNFDDLEKYVNNIITDENVKYMQAKAANFARMFKKVSYNYYWLAYELYLFL